MPDITFFGLHEPGGEKVVGLPKGSMIVFTHELGHDPSVKTGYDYRQWADYLCVARLNNGYYPNGTIPAPDFYDQFAIRCANFVAASKGCTHWIIANEPNHSQERPRNRDITATSYVQCFNLVESAIHAVQPAAVVIPAAVAPWNVETGDWLVYFDYLMANCKGIGGIAIHTYTHGADPALITSLVKMDAPYNDRYYHFRAYTDFLTRIPARLTHLPVFITETNQDSAWKDQNTGWVQAAYEEIAGWNRNFVPTIRAMALYRWPKYDKWFIEGKSGVIADMKAAIAKLNNGGEQMWKIAYRNDCEEGFYDKDGIPELTIPKGMALHYIHGGEGNFPRPECDAKDKQRGHPEVFPDGGRYTATGFYLSATGRFGYVSPRIQVGIGAKIRASVDYMHIFDGVAAGGSKIGIVQGDGPFGTSKYVWPLADGVNPFESSAITYGEWVGTYNPRHPNRTWTKLRTPEMLAAQDYVRIVTLFHADTKGVGSHCFWDNWTLETDADTTVPPQPQPGTCDALLITQEQNERIAGALEAISVGLHQAAAIMRGEV